MNDHKFLVALVTFCRRQVVPALGFLGAALAAIGVWENISWLSLVGTWMAAFAVLAISIWQNELNERLLEQAETIASQAIRLETLVTGGSGIVYLSFSPSGSNRFELIVVNPNDTPLYDISASLFDTTLAALTPNPPANLNWNRLPIPIGNLSGHTAKPTGIFVDIPSTSTKQGYNIFFSARNGFWTQLQRFQRVGDQWLSAALVDGGIAGAPARYQAINERFPRNPANEIEWN